MSVAKAAVRRPRTAAPPSSSLGGASAHGSCGAASRRGTPSGGEARVTIVAGGDVLLERGRAVVVSRKFRKTRARLVVIADTRLRGRKLAAQLRDLADELEAR